MLICENISETGGAPVVQLVKTVHSVLTWHNPALTACTFLVSRSAMIVLLSIMLLFKHPIDTMSI